MSIHLNKILFSAAVLIPFMTLANVGVISQEDVDRIVDAEILMYEHDEDFQAAEKSLVDKGVTRAMLAHGYYSAMVRTMNAERGSLEAEKFHSAVFGYVQSADETQLTNLLTIASSTTNERSVSKAICSFHARSPLSRPLIQWCVKKLVSEDCQKSVRYDIMACMEKSMKQPNVPLELKAKVLSCARKVVLTEPLSAFVADRILSSHEEGYTTSDLRKRAAHRISTLKDDVMPDVVRRHFEVLSGRKDEE